MVISLKKWGCSTAMLLYRRVSPTVFSGIIHQSKSASRRTTAESGWFIGTKCPAPKTSTCSLAESSKPSVTAQSIWIPSFQTHWWQLTNRWVDDCSVFAKKSFVQPNGKFLCMSQKLVEHPFHGPLYASTTWGWNQIFKLLPITSNFPITTTPQMSFRRQKICSAWWIESASVAILLWCKPS